MEFYGAVAEQLLGAQQLSKGFGGSGGRGRGGTSVPNGRLACPSLLLAHHACGFGWKLLGHPCHLKTQADEDRHQLLYR